MRKTLKFILLPLFAAIALGSNLLAQESTAGYYATVEKEGDAYIIVVKHHEEKPIANETTIFKVSPELTDYDFSKSNGKGYDFDNLSRNTYVVEIKRARLEVDDNFKPKYTCAWFNRLSALESIEGLENLNTSEVVSMNRMFNGCERLQAIDLRNFNTEKVDSMDYMFYGCKLVKTLDLSGFNTSNVKRMLSMFTDCASIESLDLSGFNTENVADMSSMFSRCTALREINLSSFNTERIKDFGSFFLSCASLTSIDLSSFSFKNVTAVNHMFNACAGLKHIFCEEETELINAANVSNIYQVFKECSTLVGVKADGSLINWNSSVEWDASKGTDISKYFTTADKGGYFTVKKDEYSVLGLDKTTYEIGEELDLSGAYINRTRKYGNTEEIANLGSLEDLDLQVEGFDKTKPGTQTVFVMYNGKEVSFEIEVLDAVKEYVVEVQPTKTQYTMPITLEDLDLAGGLINKVWYSEKTEELNMSDLTYEISGLDVLKPGEQTLEVKFSIGEGEEYVWKDYKITLVDAVAELKLTTEPKNKEFVQGQKLDIEEVVEGAGLELVWVSGKTDKLSLGAIVTLLIPAGDFEMADLLNDIKTKYGLEIELFSTENLGTQNVVIKCGELEVSWEVNVNLNTDNEAVFGGVAAFEAWASGGVLSVSVARDGVLEVLSVNGAVICRVEVQGGSSLNLPLEKGVYILRLGGEFKKVVIE